jgi:hypothetical protein
VLEGTSWIQTINNNVAELTKIIDLISTDIHRLSDYHDNPRKVYEAHRDELSSSDFMDRFFEGEEEVEVSHLSLTQFNRLSL